MKNDLSFKLVEGARSRSGWLLCLLAAFLLIVGVRCQLIQSRGSSLPYYDEWELLFNTFYPACRGDYDYRDLFVPHGEHPILLMKLAALAVLRLNEGQWDSLIFMTLGALIFAGTMIALAAMTRSTAGSRAGFVVLAAAVLYGVLPFGWFNLLWGFQLIWFLLLVLTLGVFWGLLLNRTYSPAWWGGVVCGFLAAHTLGSGFVAAGVVFALKLYERFIVRRERPETGAAPTMVISGLIVVWALVRLAEIDGHTELYTQTWRMFFSFFGTVLAWPWTQRPWFSVLVYLPLLVLGLPLLWYRRALSPGETLAAALGGWTIVQGAAMAYARSLTALGAHPISRYWDLLSFGAFGCLLAWLLLLEQRPERKMFVGAAAGSWLIFMAVGFSIMAPAELTVFKGNWKLRRDQLLLTRAYLRSADPQLLDSKYVPFPKAVLRRYLDQPAFQELLPGGVRPVRLIPDPTGVQTSPFAAAKPESGKYSWQQLGSREIYSSENADPARTGMFQSLALAPGPHRYLEIPVLGYRADAGLSLSLGLADGKDDLRVPGEAAPDDNWSAVYVANPGAPYTLRALDTHPQSWFAFSAPRGVGTLTYCTRRFLKWHKRLCWCAGLALLLSFAAAAASQFRRGAG
jgi:hypothetical protein